MSFVSHNIARALARKGIVVIGLQALPDMTSAMPFANATTGYLVNDNGIGRVLTAKDLKEAAQ